MKLLLTGGCGFIGSNFVRLAQSRYPDWFIINLDALTYSGNKENLAQLHGESDSPKYKKARQYYRFVHGNVCDFKLVCELVKECDAVVHMAAQSHVDRSLEDGRAFVQTNVLGTQTLLEALRSVDPQNKKRLVHVSTDEVFGDLPLDGSATRFTETSPRSGNNPYAASKAASDLLVQAYHHSFGLNTCITNCSNNFGPYQFPEKLIPLFVTRLIDNKKVPLYGDGQNVRDWIHVDDHCQALIEVLRHGRAGQSYNIGANNEISNIDITKMILKITEKNEDMIEYVKDRPGHDLRYGVDISKVTNELGWKPERVNFHDTLKQTVDWYINNQSWWRKIKAR